MLLANGLLIGRDARSNTQRTGVVPAGPRALVHRYDHLDLDRYPARQLRYTDCAASVSAELGKCQREKTGGRIDDLRLLLESGSRCDEAGDFDDSRHTPKISELGLELGQPLQYARLGSALSLLERNLGAELAGHQNFGARTRYLTADIGQVAMHHYSDILICRRDRLRQAISAGGQACFDLSSRHMRSFVNGKLFTNYCRFCPM